MAPAITSLEGFIRRVKASGATSEDALVVYRGHSDRKLYKLSPSVLRKPTYSIAERNIIREIVTLHPGEFSNDQTTFERLVRMQHYSLPTRLLDVTANPLVALYFACKANPTKQGEVILFRIAKRRVKYFDSDTASCIANLANLSTNERNVLRRCDDAMELNESPAALRLLHFIKAEKPYFLPRIDPDDLNSVLFVKAKQSNRRILAQQGAFLLFGLTSELKEDNGFQIEIERIRVSAKKKSLILRELDSISINPSTLFPEIEIAAQYIMQKLAPD